MIALYLHSRPRFVALILVLVATVGAAGLLSLPRLEDPTLSARFALVKTVLPGSDALRVETEITERVEEALQEVDQIRLMRSQSRPGISVVTLELKDHVDIESGWAEVRQEIDRIESSLPQDAKKPELETLDVRAYALILSLSWTGNPPANPVILQRQAEKLEDILLGVKGTESVKTFGSNPEEVTVLLDQDKLQSQNLSPLDIAEPLARQEARITSGQMISSTHRHVIQTDTRFHSADEVRTTPSIPTPSGDFLSLDSVGRVRRGIALPLQEEALVAGREAIVLAVYAEDHIRVDRWTDEALKALKSWEVPNGLQLDILFEQNETVESRLSTLALNLLLAVVGVSAVILLMMGWRASLVVATSIPLTAACVLGGLVFMGIPIHQMSVTGLIVALGLMIDNAIVITDEMKTERDGGHGRRESVRIVVKRLTLPLTSSTATTVLAFLPIALLPGGVGEFVGSIAITVIIALISSLILSLTVLPVLFLWLEGETATSGDDIWCSPKLVNLYRRMLRHPWTTISLSLILPIMGFLTVPTLQEQFFPPTDRAQIRMTLELSNSRTAEATRRAAQEVREALLEDQRVEEVHWVLGRSIPKFYYNLTERRAGEPNYAEALIQLKSNTGTTLLIRSLQEKLDRRFPSYRPRVIQLEQGPPFDAPVEIHLYGADLAAQRAAGDRLRLELSQDPRVVATNATLSNDLANLELKVDVVKTRRAGLDPERVARFLAVSTLGQRVGTIFEETEALPVVVRLADADRASLARLDSLKIKTPKGAIPLSSLVEWRMVPEQAGIAHRHQRRCNSVQAFTVAGTLPATVLNPLLKKLETGEIRLPPGITYEIGGEAEQRNRAVGNLMVYVAPLVVLMLSSLVVAFGSFRLAFLVGAVGLLSAGSGFGTLALLGIPFGFNAIIGTMGLLGVAINDSTVVITALQEEAPQGDPEQVARTVARSTRHVVATTLTTIAGFLPLLLGADRFWHPLAGVMAGGVGGATLMALMLCPVVFMRLKGK